MIINRLNVEVKSKANEEYINQFFKEINGLNKKIVDMLNLNQIKIILTDKLSDVINKNDDIEKYQDYHPDDRDKLTHGLCSDEINALCIFSDTTQMEYIGAILYHEIGHYIDYFENWGTDNLSNLLSKKNEFINAYRNDITKHWDKIIKDNRFRLKHYIQNSTPNKISEAGLYETFAFCYARNNNKFDEVDIISDYFLETLSVSKKIIDNYLSSL